MLAAVRTRVSRWLHSHMLPGARHSALDATFIGRRGHHSETTTYAAVVKLGLHSEKLSHAEPAPAERMAADTQRVSLVMAARNGVWGEVLDDPEKSWEGNLTVTLRWHESRQKERRVDVVKLGPVVAAMSDLVLEGTRGATITNAVIDAMIASAGGDEFAA